MAWVWRQVKLYATTVILLFSLLLAEVHTLFEMMPKESVNWIWKIKVPMPVQQNVKMVTDQAWYILIFALMFLILVGNQNNRINRASVLTFVVFSVIDAGMYFYNYKTYDYAFVYPGIFLIWIIIYKRNGKRRSTTNGQRMDDKTEWSDRNAIGQL